MFFRKPPSGWPNIQWKRPHEISSNPELFVAGGSRMDVIQGVLGDCWLLAAIACLTTNEQLLHKVVLPDQSFSQNYGGIFRFRFWQYGRWVEVFIDDRLPCQGNKLIYMHSEERNEFWSALLEKAYAKLCGSYESLSGGLTSEALTDFTGGVVERYELRDKAPSDLFMIMERASRKGALMGCSIDAEESQMEAKLTNGLIIGHAYSITAVKQVKVRTSNQEGAIPLLRVRNPWGDSHEWKGAWSDGSQEWQLVPQDEKRALGLTFEHDGEFWMSYKDFVRNFEKLEICFLGPDSLNEHEEKTGKRKWEGILFEGSWRKRVNAGGCRNYIASFWTNPQYRVNVAMADENSYDGKGTILVGVMQKERRRMKKEGVDLLTIGYAVYKAPQYVTGTLDRRFFETNAAAAKSSVFSNLREVSDHHRLPPGDFIVVPSTFEPNDEGDFILRIFSEREYKGSELDDTSGVVDKDAANIPKTPEDKASKDRAKQGFLNLAGSDGEIDAFELQSILNQYFMKEFDFKGFSIDLTRSMVAMRDFDFSGKLGFEDFKALWTDLTICKRAFKLADLENTGCFNSFDFKTVLTNVACQSKCGIPGMRISNATLNAIIVRYSDREGKVRFDNFVACYVKLKTLFDTFTKKDPNNQGKANFSTEEFIVMALYS
ncbi:hypothetical protein HELRODRAFT_185955 [Helobdella robusta]|uniref:Calpain catalytic domain-containing protein n=1 Tax=Helobdella robusta TaxID=6412 RepID=T1FNH3_HELRO|nr:hypothetical protein HELRODRAFT_185955 [Helobdella robusta]ESN95936.1 hypothetical protein HELRODRAFT_185955 [Helobdella robusta]